MGDVSAATTTHSVVFLFNTMENNYSVYQHVTPDKMYYFGATSNIKRRWKNNGAEYKGTSLQPYIEKFGWDNIQHIVLFREQTKENALWIENFLIETAREDGVCINKQRSGLVSKEEGYQQQISKHHYEQNREKILEQDKQYYKQNKDKILEHKREYRQQNKDKIKQYYEQNKDKKREYNREYYEQNKDKISEHNRQYRQQNKEKIQERKKQYYEQNKEQILEQKKQYYEQNKDKKREYDRQRYQKNRDKILEQKRQHQRQYRQRKKLEKQLKEVQTTLF